MKRLLLLLSFLPSISIAATRTIANGGGFWNATATWVEAAVPNENDDVVATGTSGSITLTASAKCKSIDMTNYVSSITHPAAITLQIGSTMTFVTGMTYLMGNSATSAISFLGSNSTGTITTAGKVIGNATFGGGGAVFILGDQWISTNTAQTVTFTSGSFRTNGQIMTIGSWSSSNANTRDFNFTNSSITLTASGNAWNMGTATGSTGTMVGSTLTFTASGATIQSGSAAGTPPPYDTIIFTGGGTSTLSLGGSGLIASSFTVLGTNTKTCILSISNFRTLTVTRFITLSGNSDVNRLLIQSTSSNGSDLIITGSTATWANVDFTDITLTPSLDLSAITGNSGDCGGNSGMTLTTPATQTNSGSASFTWSTAANWTSRVPLCQDDVTINGAFSSGRIITMDMPRLGKNIDMSAATWAGTAPTLSNATGNSVFGSWTLPTGLLWSANSGFTFFGRNGNFTITNGGLIYPTSIAFTSFGSTYTLQDAYATTSGFTTTFSNGVFDANDFSVTGGVFTFSNSATVYIKMKSGTWTASGVGTPWNMAGTPTLDSGTSLIFFSNTSGSTKAFGGASKTYYDITIASSTTSGTTAFSGSNSFNNFIVRAPKRIPMTATSTQTIRGQLYTDSVSGSSVTFVSVTPGTPWIITKATPNAGHVCLDWVSLQDSRANPTQGVWYAGDNATNVANNTNWKFESCYRQSNYFLGM